MLPVIPLVVAVVSAAILTRKKKRRYLHGTIHHDLSRFARQYGVTVADDGSFDPNALVDGEPLLFYMFNDCRSVSDLNYLEMLLSYGANPDICNSKGVPALIYALSCLWGDEIVSTLLQHGANPNAMDSEGRTAVFFADSPKVLSVLRDAGAELNAVDANGEPALFYWLSNAKTRNCLDGLLACGVNPDICNSEGVPALIYALSCPGGEENISTLLQSGANPNVMDSNGRTAVFFADSPNVLSVLRDAGATFNAVDAMGKPAFFYIPSIGRTLYFIQTAGVDVNVTDREGKTIAFYISGPADFLLLKTLEAEGLDIHAKDNSGNTFAYLKEYLCCAMRRYNKPASKRLYEAVNNNDIPGAIRALKEGADPDTRDESVNGWNMIFLAIYKNNPEMIKELVRFGGDINHMNGTICPLEKAIYDKNEACVEMLLSLGANPKPAMLTLQYSATPEIKKIFSRYGHTV